MSTGLEFVLPETRCFHWRTLRIPTCISSEPFILPQPSRSLLHIVLNGFAFLDLFWDLVEHFRHLFVPAERIGQLSFRGTVNSNMNKSDLFQFTRLDMDSSA